MKPLSYALIAAVAACGFASAQTTAYTTPVGYNTQSLAQGYNVVGLTLQTPTLAAGDFSAVAGKVLTDTGMTYAPVAGRTYILEITSGVLIGSIQEVPAASITADTITTPDDLALAGLVVGDKYKLRLAPSLEEVFTTVPLANGGVLTATLNIANSDVIWVPSGPSTFDKYFLKSGTTPAFQKVTGTTSFTPTPVNSVPLIYTDGMYIQKKLTNAASLVVTGEVKTIGSNSVLNVGYNLVSMVAPVGMTLRTAGFEDDLTKTLNVANSDIVWVQNPDLSYVKYFCHSSQGWRYATGTNGTNVDPLVDPPLGTAVLIQKKVNAQATLDLLVPASYASL